MNLNTAVLYGALALALSTCAHAQDGPEFSFSGFGTLGLVHSNENQADFTPDLQTNEGVGASQRTSPRPDSRLAGQIDAKFSEKFSAVLQATSEYAERSSYAPKITLAHVKYQFAPNLAMRIGRINTPLYMLSEYQRVGYATPWVRPPYEVYNFVTALDGVDGVYTHNLGQSVLNVQGFYGRIDSKYLAVHAVRGLALTLDQGASTYRLAYIKARPEYRTAQLEDLFRLYDQINPALADRLSPFDSEGSFASVGYSYDPGKWFLRTEVIQVDNKQAISGKTTNGYLSTGVRLGTLTPSLTYGHVDTKLTKLTAGEDPLGVMTNAIAFQEAGRHSYTASLRWDVHENMAFKFQASHIMNNAGSYGGLGNIQPGFRTGGSYNLLSASFDFVF